MKKNITRFAALVSVVTLFAFASCQKNEEEKTVFTATVENTDSQAKTAFNGGAMTWKSGDRIRVYEGEDFAELRTSSNNTAMANFSFCNGYTLPMTSNSYYAIYPADMVIGYNALTLPPAQTYGEGGILEAPMYAYSTSNELAFKNLCGVLCISITANKSISFIVVTADQPLHGNFVVAEDNVSLTPASTTTDNAAYNDVLLDCGDGVDCSTTKDFYIYLPPTTYHSMTIEINTTDDSRCVKTLTDDFIVGRNKYYTLSINNTNNAHEFKPINGSKGGMFSVSDTKKVWFSQGNLNYQASTNTWSFSMYQDEYLSDDNENIGSDGYNGWIDLFGWGTGSNPTLASEDYRDYQTFVDWGANAIDNGGNAPNLWRTLSKDEWNYLLNERSGNRYAKGWVNWTFGVILLPDGYTHPTDIDAINDINVSGEIDMYNNDYDVDAWNLMEAAGAVFLPAAGYREGTAVSDVEDGGGYWSSTPEAGYSSSAWSVSFYDNYLTATSSAGRPNGYSVRLVRDNN